MTTNAISVQIDPTSGLPLGSVIKNHKGEYGVIGFNSVIRVSEKVAKEIMAEAEGQK